MNFVGNIDNLMYISNLWRSSLAMLDTFHQNYKSVDA